MTTNWHLRFIDLARHIAEWSKDPSTQVGAVITDDDHRVLGLGYNGFPRGVADTPERLNDRPTKYAHVVHAELNAILNTSSSKGTTLYCTHIPCTGCAKAIIQSGIKFVFVPSGSHLFTWADDQEQAADMLSEAGVQMNVVMGG